MAGWDDGRCWYRGGDGIKSSTNVVTKRKSNEGLDQSYKAYPLSAAADRSHLMMMPHGSPFDHLEPPGKRTSFGTDEIARGKSESQLSLCVPSKCCVVPREVRWKRTRVSPGSPGDRASIWVYSPFSSSDIFMRLSP